MDLDMDLLRERVRTLREDRELSARALSIAIGMGESYIQSFETGLRGKRGPGPVALTRLASYFGMTVEDLVAPARVGRVAAVRESRPRRLTAADLFRRFGIAPYDEPRSAEGVVASAGPGAGVPQDVDDTMPRRRRRGSPLWEVPVQGDCMEPDIHSGEVLIYSDKLPVEIGSLVVALRDEDQLLIKRLTLVGDEQVLRSNGDEAIPVDERVRILGRAVSAQRRLL